LQTVAVVAELESDSNFALSSGEASPTHISERAERTCLCMVPLPFCSI